MKIKIARIPRKLKKKLKNDPYYCLFGWIWIREYKSRAYSKFLKKLWIE